MKEKILVVGAGFSGAVIARTLADLAGSDTVNQRHVMQAVSFRRTPS